MITYSLALSEQCNLNCTYCNVDKLSKKVISFDAFKENFEKIRHQNPNEKIQIDFYGGEPLLHWDLICQIIAFTKSDKNVVYYMPTNGLLLTEEKVQHLNENEVTVSLSFDGLWQNQNRPQHSGNKTLELYLNKRELFGKINDLECHSMIYKGCFNLLENHQFITEQFNLNPNLTLIRDVGVWDYESASLVNKGYSDLVNWYIEHHEDVELPNLLREYLSHVVLYSSKKMQVNYCGAGDTHLSLTENKLVPCNRFKDEDSINKIEEFKYMKACQSCEVKNYCKKGCLYENIKNDGPLDEICEMYKHFYKETLRLVKTLQSTTPMKETIKDLIYES